MKAPAKAALRTRLPEEIPSAAAACASAVLLLGVVGCATPPQAKLPPRAWSIEPQMGVSHPVSAQAWYAIGRQYDDAREWEQSVAAYRKAVAADARHVPARNALGVALARSGRLGDAEAELREAMALAPDAAYVRSNLGQVLTLAGRADEAVALLEGAVRMDAQDDTARANLRYALSRVDTPRQADRPGQEVPAQVHDEVPEKRASASTAVPPALPTAVELPLPITQAEVPVPLASPAPRYDQSPLSYARVEISNGNGVPGMAARVGRWLATHEGPRQVRLSNQKPYAQRETVVQYRAGHAAQAWRLAHLLPGKVQAVPAPATQQGDLRVVLGRDWTRIAANDDSMLIASMQDDGPLQ